MHINNFEHEVIQPPEDKIAIYDQLLYLGELVEILIEPEEEEKQEQVIKDFM
jgi:hypothetical protein